MSQMNTLVSDCRSSVATLRNLTSAGRGLVLRICSTIATPTPSRSTAGTVLIRFGENGSLPC